MQMATLAFPAVLSAVGPIFDDLVQYIRWYFSKSVPTAGYDLDRSGWFISLKYGPDVTLKK